MTLRIAPFSFSRTGQAALVAVLALCLQALPAAAEKRVALVVGIDRYDHLADGLQLKKAANDATAVGDTLRDLGYEVVRAENVGRVEFLRQWSRFLNAVEPGSTAAFFFAGHGVEIGGVNYLIPRDVPRVGDGEEELLKGAALSLDMLLGGFRARKPAVSLIVLDACRDNPFVTSRGRSLGGSRGLADVRPPSGTFIMYSAGAGQRAIDRLSETDPDANSIYTRALLPKLRTPGLGITEIARQVRLEVRETAKTVGHEQVPAYYDEVVGNFCPAGCAVPAAGTPEAKAVEEARAKAEAERQRLALLQQEVERLRAIEAQRKAEAEAERLRAEAKRRAEEEAMRTAEAARPDPALSVTPGSGRSFRDCPQCPEMVVVPAGSFTMGSPASEIEALVRKHRKYKLLGDRYRSEGPQRAVTIDRPFAVGKFEVTFAEWDACLADEGCRHIPHDGLIAPQNPPGWGRGRRPVINVSWYNIVNEYLPWLSRKAGKTYRLPTEAEWEYAARAGTTTRYAFGNTITERQAKFAHPMKFLHPTRTMEVGSFRPNAFGLYDMHGNVQEVVADCPSRYRCLRGGSHWTDPDDLRSAARDTLYLDDKGDWDIGFRVARTLDVPTGDSPKDKAGPAVKDEQERLFDKFMDWADKQRKH